MKREEFENKILDYLDGNLSPEESSNFETAMAQDVGLKSLFKEYQEVIALEASLAGVTETPHPSFSAKVLKSIDSDAGFFRRKFMEIIRSRRTLAFTASTACLLLCVGLLLNNDSSLVKRRLSLQETPVAPTGGQTEYNDTRLANGVESVFDYLSPKSTNENANVPERELQEKNPTRNELAAVEQKNSENLSKKQDFREQDKATARKNRGTASTSSTVMIDDLVAAPRHRRQHAASGRMKVGGKEYSIGADGSLGAIAAAPAAPAEKRKGKVLEEEALNRYGASPQKREAFKDSKRKPQYLSTGEDAESFELDVNAPGYQQGIQQALASRERYGQWEENKATLVSTEPLSTFSIDVDTGSYTNARRFLNQGSMPPADSVRIEEFINYFSYNYEKPTDKPFALNYEIAPSPLEKDHYLLKLGLQAKDASDIDKPWNLVFLIDVSGSMSSTDKLGLAKKALGELVRNMGPKDRVSIVTYAGNSGVLLRPTGMKHRKQIIQAINSLGAGGSTHGSAGIHGAYQVAKNSFIDGGVNRVVLLTDGDFNVGTTGNADLIALIEEKRRSGVTLTTVGVGSGNYNEAMMEQLANKGNGNYFYLDSEKEAKKVFGHDLASNMEVVAKDVKIQVEFNPAVVSQYRLIGYDNRRLKKEDFNNDRIDAGEVGAGHTVTALYEIVLSDSKLGKELKEKLRYQKKETTHEVASNPALLEELGFFKLRYKEPTATRSKLLTFPLKTNAIEQSVSETSNDFRFAAAVSYFGHKLRQSQHAGEYRLAEVRELAASAVGKDEKGYRKEFLELVDKANR